MKRPLFFVNHQTMRFSLFFLLIVLVSPSIALGSEGGPSQKVAPHQILRGRFVEVHALKGIDKPLRSEGRFVVAPQRGVIWAVEKPFPITFVFTKAGMVQFVAGVPFLRKQAQAMPFLAHVNELLSAALSGEWAPLDPYVSIKRSGTTKSWRVKMTPRPTPPVRLPFRSLAASGNHFVDKADVVRLDGLSDSYSFYDQAISAASLTQAEEMVLSQQP